MTNQKLLTPPQLAEQYGICKDTILDRIRDGELPAVLVSKNPHGQRQRYKVFREDFEKFLERRKTGRKLQQPEPVRKPLPEVPALI